ncbi:hypothetical protein Micbo1qcDRAFT_180883 [Microdochium bolleyi]|uniref:Uncharacterized protein n=1 Tax=Microdochium bolleyi TaxID=196109 RepID=A0A136IKD1_9PEZI|nr:hypothetical protein Micbo1qcDRAFT_180883 [Microdochium bolleyi]
MVRRSVRIVIVAVAVGLVSLFAVFVTVMACVIVVLRGIVSLMIAFTITTIVTAAAAFLVGNAEHGSPTSGQSPPYHVSTNEVTAYYDDLPRRRPSSILHDKVAGDGYRLPEDGTDPALCIGGRALLVFSLRAARAALAQQLEGGVELFRAAV